MLAWGATAIERERRLPGDHLVPDPTHSTTHAITINAPPEAIWPWLVQMDQDRAGFYTHNWVERLLRSGIPDTHELHPEWQHQAVGNLMRTNRELRPGHPVGWPWWQVPFRLLLFEPLHAYMETGVLRGIKVQTEGEAGTCRHHP